MVAQSHAMLPVVGSRVRLIDFRFGLCGGMWGQNSGDTALRRFFAYSEQEGLGFRVVGKDREAEVYRVPVRGVVRRYVLPFPTAQMFRAEREETVRQLEAALFQQRDGVSHPDAWKSIPRSPVELDRVGTKEHIDFAVNRAKERERRRVERVRLESKKRTRRNRRKRWLQKYYQAKRAGEAMKPVAYRRSPRPDIILPGRWPRIAAKGFEAVRFQREEASTYRGRRRQQRMSGSELTIQEANAIAFAMRIAKPVKTEAVKTQGMIDKFLEYAAAGKALPADTTDEEATWIGLGQLLLLSSVIPARRYKFKIDWKVVHDAQACVAFLRGALEGRIPPPSSGIHFLTWMRKHGKWGAPQLFVDLITAYFTRSCSVGRDLGEIFEPAWFTPLMGGVVEALDTAIEQPWVSKGDYDWGPSTLDEAWDRLRDAGYVVSKYNHTDAILRQHQTEELLFPKPPPPPPPPPPEPTVEERAQRAAALRGERMTYFSDQSLPKLLFEYCSGRVMDLVATPERECVQYWVEMGWGQSRTQVKHRVRTYLQRVRAIDDELWQLGESLEDLPRAGVFLRETFLQGRGEVFAEEVRGMLTDPRGDGMDPRTEWAYKYDHPMIGKKRGGGG